MPVQPNICPKQGWTCLHCMQWAGTIKKYLSTSGTFHNICENIQHETARLAELKTKLHPTDKGTSQWLSDVKEWVAHETSETSHASQGTTHRKLQQSIEGLYLSVMLRKQTLYCQNDSSKLCHRLQRKLADDKSSFFRRYRTTMILY